MWLGDIKVLPQLRSPVCINLASQGNSLCCEFCPPTILLVLTSSQSIQTLNIDGFIKLFVLIKCSINYLKLLSLYIGFEKKRLCLCCRCNKSVRKIFYFRTTVIAYVDCFNSLWIVLIFSISFYVILSLRGLKQYLCYLHRLKNK